MKKLFSKLPLFIILCLLTGLFTVGCGKSSEGDTIGDLFYDIITGEDRGEVTETVIDETGTYISEEESGRDSTAADLGENGEDVPTTGIDENGTYTSKEDVALYIHEYGKLPQNFITKKEAEKLGWSGGSLEPYAPGKCIGGSHFGNYEEKLPDKDGRSYTECDIDTLGAKSRGAKRIVYSNDGLIYYTEDHYETFELLYGEE